MKTQTFLKSLVFLALTSLFFACEKEDTPKPDKEDPDDQNPPTEIDHGYSKGAFIICEGNFSSNDGAISYVTASKVIRDIYFDVNDVPLGDIVQSFFIHDTLGFIVVNNSQKVEVVNLKTFTWHASIQKVSYPRYMAKYNNTLYLTNGNGFGGDYVYVINPSTFSISDSIPTGVGPNGIVAVGSTLFVANPGGWSTDSTVTIINAETNAVIETLTVGDVPLGMTADNTTVFVLCKGLSEYDEDWNTIPITNSKIVAIDVSTFELRTVVQLSHQMSTFASNLIVEYGSLLYFIDDDGLYTIPKTGGVPLKLVSGSFYGVSIDSKTETLWLANTSSMIQHTVEVYSLSGQKQREIETEKFPNGVVFN